MDVRSVAVSMEKQLDKDSETVQLLKRFIAEGRITGEESPGEVRELHSLFSAQDKSRFRSCYNRLRDRMSLPKSKKKEGTECNSEEGKSLKRRVTPTIAPGADKRRRLSGEECPEGAGLELFCRDLCFVPIHVKSHWVNRNMVKFQLLVILTPTGVSENQFTINLDESGELLEVSVDWPAPMCEVDVMFRRFTKIGTESRLDPDHPKTQCVESALSQLREHQMDKLKSVARITLDFPCIRNFKQHDLGWKENNANVVMLELEESVAKKYALVKKNKPFFKD